MEVVDERRLQLWDNSTYVKTPDQGVKYEQSDIAALGESFNSYIAYHTKKNIMQEPVDVSKYANIPFTEDAFVKEVNSIDNPNLRDNMLASNINSWDDYEKNKKYLEHYQKVQQQVQENISTPALVAGGLMFSLADTDALLINPTLAGVNKARNVLGLSSKLSKVAASTVAGGLVGAESMAYYELSTGVYNEGSVTDSALFGMLVGGSLGMFLEKGKQLPGKWTDETGNTFKSEADAKTELLNRTQTELQQLDETIKIMENIQKNNKVNEDNLAEAVINELKGKKDNSFNEHLKAQDNLDTFNKSFDTLVKQRDELAVLIKEQQAKHDSWYKTTQEFENVVATHDKLQKQQAVWEKELKKLKDSGSKKEGANELVNKLKGLIDNAEAELKALRVTRGNLDKERKQAFNKQEVKALQKHKDDFLNLSETLNRALNERLSLTNKANDAATVSKQAENYYNKAVKEGVTGILPDGYQGVKLFDKLLSSKQLLNPDNIKSLLYDRGLLSSELYNMKNKKFTLNNLRGLKKEKSNFVDKLASELSAIEKDLIHPDKLRNLASFKRLDGVFKKMLISPIEKLYHSDNELVRGFVRLLHAGTIHHGQTLTDNAWNIKVKHDARLGAYEKEIMYNYTEAKKAGYKGSFAEFESDVGMFAKKTLGQMQRDMFSGIKGTATEEERYKQAFQNASSVKRKYFSNNKFINKSVDNVLDYFEETHKIGKGLDMDVFVKSNPKGFIKRIYSEHKIKEIGREAAISKIVKAQRNFALHNNLPMTREIENEWLYKAQAAVDSALSKQEKMRAVTEPLGARMQTSTSSFKSRTIQAFDDDLIDVLSDDILGTIQVYGLNTHGRLALMEKLGIYKDAEIGSAINQLNATTKEKDYLNATIETILGTRELMKNPFSAGQQAVKLVSTYSSLMHVAGFGVPTLTEISSIAKEFGWSKVLKDFIPNIQYVHELYTKGTVKDKNEIRLLAEYGNAFFAYKANRFDTESGFDSVNRLQEFMDSSVHKLAVLGGMLPITDALRMTTLTSGTSFLAEMSVKSHISPTDIKRLNDMGFTEKDLPVIREKLQVDSKGLIGNMNRESWGELDKKITDGLLTMVDRTILHPNGMTLPLFMTDNKTQSWVGKIFMKFLRFPMESYERMLFRGVQEADAKQLGGFVGNVALWSAVLMAKDALREEEKQKYVGDDGMTNLLKDSLMNNSWTSAIPSVADKVYGTVTGENLTSTYSYKFFGAPQSDIENIYKLNPKFSLPFYSLSLGDATSSFMNQLKLLEDYKEFSND